MDPDSAESPLTIESRKSKSPHSGDDVEQRPIKKQKGGNKDQKPGTHRRQAACQACRLRKVKCDKKRPTCALCKASGVICEYLGDSGDKITLETATSTILDRLDSLHQELNSVKQAAHEQKYFQARSRFVQSGLHHDALPIGSHPVPLPTPPASFEPSRDFLRIPPQRGCADAILQWEVFDQKYPSNYIVGCLFSPDTAEPSILGRSPGSPSADLVASPTSLLPIEEEQIPALVDRFLQNSYTKNPIIDVEALVKQARQCADNGVGWDGWSCLVLLACALGSVAKPFDRSNPNRSGNSSARVYARELQQGDSCFTLASRRLGSLKYSMLGAQCNFFAGVYLMYTLRPLQSWHYFYQASIFCQFYLRQRHGLSDTFAEVLTAPSHTLNPVDRKARRIEQSLYWSCFKSECEFRVELPLPQSEISLGEYPNLFPSPPSPVPHDFLMDAAQRQAGLGHGSPTAGHIGLGQGQEFEDTHGKTPEELELRRHANRLCNEEESWYYYLTEIALRRISNRIINSFFNQGRSSWLNIRPLLRIAQEFEAQVSSWSAHLPPAMQQYETSSIIRAPHLNYMSESAGSHVSRELSWAIDNRLLEMQTWLYQPFLYYLIHAGSHDGRFDEFSMGSPLDGRQHVDNLLHPFSPTASSSHSFDYPTGPGHIPTSQPQPMDSNDLSVLHSLINSGIECCFKTIEVRSRGHRHHGLWYDLRSLMSASLILLGIVKSGNEAWIPGGAEMLWGTPGELNSDGSVPIGGKLGKVMSQFEFWAAEAPDMMRHRDILESVVRDARGS